MRPGRRRPGQAGSWLSTVDRDRSGYSLIDDAPMQRRGSKAPRQFRTLAKPPSSGPLYGTTRQEFATWDQYVAADCLGGLETCADAAGLILSVPWWKLTRLGHAEALPPMYSTSRAIECLQGTGLADASTWYWNLDSRSSPFGVCKRAILQKCFLFRGQPDR